jgi:hypothetical protein
MLDEFGSTKATVDYKHTINVRFVLSLVHMARV